MYPIELYRGFSIYANCEASITTGNTPRELYHTRHIHCGGVDAWMIEKEPVNFKAYCGGHYPEYADTIENLKCKIDRYLGPLCERCEKVYYDCDCIDGAV